MRDKGIAVRIFAQDPWRDIRRDLALADACSAASKQAQTKWEADNHLSNCLVYSVKALRGASKALGQPIGSVSELRDLLD